MHSVGSQGAARKLPSLIDVFTQFGPVVVRIPDARFWLSGYGSQSADGIVDVVEVIYVDQELGAIAAARGSVRNWRNGPPSERIANGATVALLTHLSDTLGIDDRFDNDDDLTVFGIGHILGDANAGGPTVLVDGVPVDAELWRVGPVTAIQVWSGASIVTAVGASEFVLGAYRTPDQIAPSQNL